MSEIDGVPKGWTIAAIRDFATTATGGTPSRLRADYFGGDVPWVKSGELGDGIVHDAAESLTQLGVDESNAKVFPKGTLCIALYGATVGKLGVLGMDATTNQAVCGIFLPDGIDTKYVFHFLSSIRRELIRMGKGGAQSNISNGIVRETLVPLAPLNEQRRIVGKIEELFSDLEAGVAVLTRARGNLKRYRASVLKAAVEGTLTADWRTAIRSPAFRRNEANSTPVSETESRLKAGLRTAGLRTVEPASKLLARILTERRRQWEADQLAKFAAAGKQPPNNWQAKYAEPATPDTTNLPTLPDGWCWASVEQCALDVTVGHVGSMKDEYVSDGIPFLRSQNVRPLRYDRAGLRFIPGEFHEQLSKSKLYGGELLVVRSGNIGEACVYPAGEPEANCADLVITRLAGGIVSQYVATFVTSPHGIALVGGKRTGSALSHFNVGAMAKSPIPLPPLAEQAEIVATVSEKLSQIESAEVAIEHSLRRAARLRQSILKQAFEGKLVPQDPTDEPASSLLERLRSSRSIHEGNAQEAIPARTRGRGAKSKQVVELPEQQPIH